MMPVAAVSGPIDTGSAGKDSFTSEHPGVRGIGFATQGVGRISCERFLREREESSKLYWNIGGWIDGFLTGYNAYVPDTYDITAYAPRDSADSFSILLARHCNSNPEDAIGLVVKSIAEQLHPVRLQKEGSIVEVEVADNTYTLYRETISTVQKILSEEGLYDGKIDGQYGPKTKAAVQAFQHSQNLRNEGAPNQDTLLRILFRKVANTPSTD